MPWSQTPVSRDGPTAGSVCPGLILLLSQRGFAGRELTRLLFVPHRQRGALGISAHHVPAQGYGQASPNKSGREWKNPLLISVASAQSLKHQWPLNLQETAAGVKAIMQGAFFPKPIKVSSVLQWGLHEQPVEMFYMLVGCSNRSSRQHLSLPVFSENPLWVDIFQAVSVNWVGSQFSKAFSIFFLLKKWNF